MNLVDRISYIILQTRRQCDIYDGTELEEEISTLTDALYRIEQECKSITSEDDTALLNALAREWRETPEKLLSRLIQKENFDRHGQYLPLNGKIKTHECNSLDCFLKAKQNG